MCVFYYILMKKSPFYSPEQSGWFTLPPDLYFGSFYTPNKTKPDKKKPAGLSPLDADVAQSKGGFDRGGAYLSGWIVIELPFPVAIWIRNPLFPVQIPNPILHGRRQR